MTDPETGFTGASAALGAIRSENSWIQQQISSGQLTMDPESAEEAAKAYEDEAVEVAKLIRDAEQLDRVKGLGDYPSGRQLAQKFGQKAKNGSTGAADLLAQLRDEMDRKAGLFRQAAKNYIATDEQISQDFQRGAEQ